MMRAIRLHPPGGIDSLSLDEIDAPVPGAGEALVRVHAAGITRDELDWPTDRLPAIPSYELSGVVEGLGAGVAGLEVGDEVYALTPFDRDGVAAEHAVLPAAVLAPRPRSLDHLGGASLPMPGLTAWQALFEHGRLEAGERVLIHGAAGGVGHIATQLAHRHGAYVIGTATGTGVAEARELGADEVIDRAAASFEDAVAPVDLVFDTVGGEALLRSRAVLRPGGRLVSVAEEPPAGQGTYFVVAPNRDQLIELARLADEGALRPAVDSVFELADARTAFERLATPGKRGKVVLRVA